ncbi:MAG: haloacid dehalogenase-like hydrolase [Gammaproteobacteria bacterium]
MNDHSELPLCVDLDGTLIFTDALVESAARSFFRAPGATLGALASLRKGRAAFKARMLQRGSLDVATLPFNTPLIERLRDERARGRRLVLVTAANERVAHAVQAHLQLFDDVFASTEAHNLKGPAKSQFLVERYGAGGFVYVGDSAADRAVWLRAAAAWTVGEEGLRVAGRAGVSVAAQFAGATATVGDWFRALGIDRWLWNLLVLLPWALFTQTASKRSAFILLAALIGFCLAASGVALFAAIAGLEAPGHQRRDDTHPVSAGRIALVRAGLVGMGLVVTAGLATAALSPPLCGVLAVFIVSSVLFAMRPVAPGATAWLRRAWLIGLRLLAGISVVFAGLSLPTWITLWVSAAALAVVGRPTQGPAT